MSETVLSVATRAVLDACGRLGLDTQALLVAVDLTESVVRDPEARLEAAKADALWQAAYSAARDPALAFHAAEKLDFGDYKVLDYLCKHSANIGEGLTKLARYFDLVDRRARIEVTEGEPATIRFLIPGLPGPVPRPPAEYTLTAIVGSSRRATGSNWTPLDVSFSFAEPAEAAEHRRFFGCPVRYNQEHTEIRLAGKEWSRQVESADAWLGTMLEKEARDLMSSVPAEGLVGRVRNEIETDLRNATEPTLESIAQRLGLGPRTLQRRLKEVGASFGPLVDEVREAAARFYLRDSGLGLSEIAWLLGFSEQSAFNRAFRRWTGDSPGTFRAGMS